MALLVSELERGVLEEVLQIGSGGDYNVRVVGSSDPIQMEVSGVLQDDSGTTTTKRFSEKKAQVLTLRKQGFVSVTVFEHKASGVYSRLAFVTKS